MNIDDILRSLNNILERDPSKAKDVLELVCKSMNNYENSVERRRMSLASNALRNIIGFSLDSKMFKSFKSDIKIAYLIDAIYYLFPEGKIGGHSKIEIDVYNMFKELCKKEINDPSFVEWLKDIKGQEYINLVKTIINE